MLRKSDWDMKVRAPIVEGPGEDFSKMDMDRGVQDTGVPRLQQLYDQDPTDRLRIIDNDGKLYDVLSLGTKGIGIELLGVEIRYKGITPHLSWEEAQESLPREWEEFSRIRSSRKAVREILAVCRVLED